MNSLLWTCDLQPEQFEILDQIKATGYDGVEISLGSNNRNTYEQLGRYAQNIGLSVIAVCGADQSVNSISSDSDIRKAAHNWIKERINDVIAVGGTNLGGPFHTAFNHFTGHPVTPNEIQYAVEFMQYAGDYARNVGVTLTPEFLNRYETYFGNTMADLNSFLTKINHPNVLGMYDSYHANIEEKSHSEALEVIAPFLHHVHISENDRGAPGEGHIDFASVFRSLGEINFSGTIAVEAFSRQNEAFANEVNVWRDYASVEKILSNGLKVVQEGIKLMESRVPSIA